MSAPGIDTSCEYAESIPAPRCRLADALDEEATKANDNLDRAVAAETLLRSLLAHVDRINPPAGPYWSGANDQEAARALLVNVPSGEVRR